MGGYHDAPAAAAAEGHPCLRELALCFDEEDAADTGYAAWLEAAGTLPALTSLAFKMGPGIFEGADMDGEPGDAARLLRVCGWLRRCEALSKLKLTVCGDIPAHEALAAVGAAVGDRLQAPTLSGALLPEPRAAAARALYALAVCYPDLTSLELRLRVPVGMKRCAADALARELLRAAPAVAALCPSLQFVSVRPALNIRRNAVDIRGAVWRRPGGLVFQDG